MHGGNTGLIGWPMYTIAPAWVAPGPLSSAGKMRSHAATITFASCAVKKRSGTLILPPRALTTSGAPARL